jgi:hypothetical protein
MNLLLMIMVFALGVALAKYVMQGMVVLLDIALKLFKVGFVCLGLWSISAFIMYYGFGVGA